MSTQLDGLAVDEVSGVDAPANGIPGWMVIKSEDGAAAAAEAQLATLYGSLGQAMVLEDAPEDVRKSAESLAEYIEKQLGAEDDEPAPSLIDKMRSTFKRRRADADAEAEAEADVGKAKKKGGKPNPYTKLDAGDEADDGDEDDGVSKAETPPTTPSTPEPGLSQEDVVKALEAGVSHALAPVSEDLDVLKEAASRMLDRIEQLEDAATGSVQAYGQEGGVEKAAPTLRDAILSAAAGNRVTIN